MQNTILEKFSDLLLAVKDEPELKNRLIEICKLPVQQRIVEIEKFKFENPTLPITNTLNFFKNDLIVKEVIIFLTGKESASSSEYLTHSTFFKKHLASVSIASLAFIIIFLLLLLLFKDDKKNIIEKKPLFDLPESFTKQSIHTEYQKILNQDNPQLKTALIENFIDSFPACDYTEEVKSHYLKVL